MYPYIITKNSLSVFIDNKPITVDDSQPYYGAIKDAIKANDKNKVRLLLDKARAIVKFTSGKASVKDGVIYYNGGELHNAVTKRILQMIGEGFDAKPMVNFLDKLMLNPSKRSVDELLGFLEANNLPITPEGNFIAYRAVTKDFKDHHTKSMDNSVGKTVEVARNSVDDDKNRTCSYGLHFCSKEYLPHFNSGSSKYVVVEINPADVVSIPTDYNGSKGRCCKFTVLHEFFPQKDNFTVDVCQKSVYGSFTLTPAKLPKAQRRDSKGRFLPLGYNAPISYSDGYDD